MINNQNKEIETQFTIHVEDEISVSYARKENQIQSRHLTKCMNKAILKIRTKKIFNFKLVPTRFIPFDNN